MKKLFFFLFISLFFAGTSPIFSQRTKKNKSEVKYDFEIKIISGTLIGQVYKGSFSYSKSEIKGDGTESIQVNTIDFTYQGINFKKNGFDEIPTVVFENGSFKDLVMGGGPQEKRFGLNCGFERGQFGREEEAFINQGMSYFGYLDAQTYVDGAGAVTYTKKK